LEAAAIILTDIEKMDDEHSRALLYVGMSRARIRLVMLMSENCRKSYDRILEVGLAKISRG
jgi:superfamily I DNA/RNA helicase